MIYEIIKRTTMDVVYYYGIEYSVYRRLEDNTYDQDFVAGFSNLRDAEDFIKMKSVEIS